MLVSLVFSISTVLAFVAFIVYGSWWMFVLLLCGPTALTHYTFAKYGRLKLVGIRAHLKKRGMNIDPFVEKSKEITREINHKSD